jgi:hypothetical protein
LGKLEERTSDIVFGFQKNDLRSFSDSGVFQTILDREVEQPFGGKGVCTTLSLDEYWYPPLNVYGVPRYSNEFDHVNVPEHGILFHGHSDLTTLHVTSFHETYVES